jgi:large subunit ribosomal protein L20
VAGSVQFRTSNQQVMKALRSSYRNRRQKKRDFRGLWISRVNAAVRRYGLL